MFLLNIFFKIYFVVFIRDNILYDLISNFKALFDNDMYNISYQSILKNI